MEEEMTSSPHGPYGQKYSRATIINYQLLKRITQELSKSFLNYLTDNSDY